MRFSVLMVFSAALAIAQPSSGTASRIIRGSGVPSSGACSTLADVSKVYVRYDARATFHSFYVCAQTGSGAYSWELYGSGGSSGSPFAYRAYTGTSAVDFATYTDIKITASGGNPTITVSSNPATSGTPVFIAECNDGAARVWTNPASFLRIAAPVVASTCAYTYATWDGTSYQGGGLDETPSIVRLSAERAAPATPAASTAVLWPDATRHTIASTQNGSANVHIMPRTAGSADQLGCSDLSDSGSGCSSAAYVLPTKNATVKVGGFMVGAENAAAALATADLTNHAFIINDANAKTMTEASCVSDAGSQAVTVKIGSTTEFSITCVAPVSYSRSTTDGSTGYIVAASMTTPGIAAGAMLDLSGTANTTTKSVVIHLYGTVN